MQWIHLVISVTYFSLLCRTKMAKYSVCLAPYLRNHTSLWLPFKVHMCKIIRSPGIFFFFFIFYKFWFSGFLVRQKGKKWSKMTNNSVHYAPYLRNHKSCDCHLWYTFVKWYISRRFSFFISFDFSGCYWGKRAKNG